MSNSGFVDVATKPAGAGSTSVPGLGTFGLQTGPTVAPNGTVLLGTLEGKVIALHPDGSAFWNRQLPAGQMIRTAPVVGSDGSVYVVSWESFSDHRGGSTVTMYRAWLNRFTLAGGAPLDGITEFPHTDFGPINIGSPNVWRFGNDEAVIVPALYLDRFGAGNWHLFAFSPTGGIMADWMEHLPAGNVTSNTDTFEFLLPTFGPRAASGFFPPPPALPGVAMATNPNGGTPAIVASDRFNKQLVGFSFCVGASCSPAPGFTERFRTSHAPRALLSEPIILPDMHSAVGTSDGVVFGGPNANTKGPQPGLGGIYAAPTVRPDGRIFVVTGGGEVVAFANGKIFARTPLASDSAARPAASRNHVYVATANGLHTFDGAGANKLLTFPWDGGGTWSPAIGPGGFVYAMAANILFVFPPPPYRPTVDLDHPLVTR